MKTELLLLLTLTICNLRGMERQLTDSLYYDQTLLRFLPRELFEELKGYEAYNYEKLKKSYKYINFWLLKYGTKYGFSTGILSIFPIIRNFLGIQCLPITLHFHDGGSYCVTHIDRYNNRTVEIERRGYIDQYEFFDSTDDTFLCKLIVKSPSRYNSIKNQIIHKDRDILSLGNYQIIKEATIEFDDSLFKEAYNCWISNAALDLSNNPALLATYLKLPKELELVFKENLKDILLPEEHTKKNAAAVGWRRM